MHLPDLPNFRDLGGLRTADGRTTRQGRFYRSATPLYLDDRQAAVLVGDLGVRIRIDLRSRAEVESGGNPALRAVEREVLLAPIGSGGSRALHDMTRPVEAMLTHYLRYLEYAGESIARIVESLARPGVPALVHCTLGKDRTGVVVAVVLASVGVVEEDIVADYMRTRGQNDRLVGRLLELPAYRSRLAALPAEVFDVMPETMTRFLDELARRHGGATGYLRSNGVSRSVLDALAAQLVVSP